MADFVANIAAGHVAEYARRVNANDPANSVFVVVAIKTTGIEADSVLRDYDDLGAVLAAANDEATNAGYARKVIDNTGGITINVDDTNNWNDIDMPDQTWTAVAAAGGAWSKLVICYDPDSTGGADSALVPMVYLDFAVTPDGTDIVWQLHADGFYRADAEP